MSTIDGSAGPERTVVIDRDGVRGWIDEAGPLPPEGRSHVTVRTGDGPALSVQRALLVGPKQGAYALRVSFAEIAASRPPAVPSVVSAPPAGTVSLEGAGNPPLIVPVVAERLVVSKRPVVTGRLRLTKRVRSHEESIDESVQVERAEVERVPINRVVDEAPAIRYEGDTMVISVVEEVMVVEKRLMLREELRITKRQFKQRISERVRLRMEEVTVERFDGQGRPRAGDRT